MELQTHCVRNLKNTLRRLYDFMFELTNEEVDSLVSQNVIPSRSKFRGALPMAFTEQGLNKAKE